VLRTECHHPSGRGISRAVLWVLRSVIVSASDSPLALVRVTLGRPRRWRSPLAVVVCLGFPSRIGPCFTGSSQALAVATRRCCLPGIPLSHWSVFT